MTHPMETRVTDTYAAHVKSVIATVADETELLTSLTNFDESALNQNARLYSGLIMAVQTRAFTAAQRVTIQAAVESLGFVYLLDTPA